MPGITHGQLIGLHPRLYHTWPAWAPGPQSSATVCSANRITGARWGLSATVVYLERNLGLPREAAFTRALGLKPDCADYRDPVKLLSELGFQ